MWMGEERKRCSIHGPEIEVTGDATCGLYVNGKPMVEMAGKEHTQVTPDESGLEKREVRCENCDFFKKPSICSLYEQLNQMSDSHFDLDKEVYHLGCCNANSPIKPKEELPERERPSEAFFRKIS